MRELVACIGDAKAHELVRCYSGRELYIPKEPRADHPIALRIGIDALQKLSAEWACVTIRLPKEWNVLRERRDAAIYADSKSGLSFTQLGDKWGLHRSRIKVIVERARELEEVAGKAEPQRAPQAELSL